MARVTRGRAYDIPYFAYLRTRTAQNIGGRSKIWVVIEKWPEKTRLPDLHKLSLIAYLRTYTYKKLLFVFDKSQIVAYKYVRTYVRTVGNFNKYAYLRSCTPIRVVGAETCSPSAHICKYTVLRINAARSFLNFSLVLSRGK